MRGDRRAPDRPHQLHAGRAATLACRLLPLTPRRGPLRRSVRGRGHRQSQPPLQLARGLPQPGIVPVGPKPAPGVLSHQQHRDMDVIIRMTDGHPPRPTRIIPLGDTGAVQQLPRDLAPLAVAEHSVPAGDPRRAVPDIPALALGPAVLG